MKLQYWISQNSKQAEFFHKIDLIIKEELPITDLAAIDYTNVSMQLLIGMSDLFGKLSFIGLRDFRHGVLVLKHSGPAACFETFLQSTWL